MAWSVLMLLGLSVHTWVSADPSAPCPAECSCLPAGRVTCSRANLTSIPLDIANSTVELHMNYNNFTFLGQSFQQDMTEMSSLYFLNCNIRIIRSDAFQKVSALKFLHVEGNEIQEIENGTFDNLSSLSQLHLSKNKISYLQPGLFSQLKKLVALYLVDNELTEISDGTLRGLTQLRWLDLSSNMISNISKEAFDGSNYLRILQLDDNLLTSVPSFKSLVDLHTLRLSGNRIRKLSSISFSRNLRTLGELYVNNNGLKKVTSLAFNRLRRLEVLDLRNNSLTSLSVSRLKSSTKIYLSGNPWKCECPIAALYIRILMANIKDPEQDVLCKSPKRFEGRSVTTINILNLNCKSFVDDATTLSPTKQTEGQTSPSAVTTMKEVITYRTTPPASTMGTNIIQEDPCFTEDISNISVRPTEEDSLVVSWSSARDYRYFQIDYSSGDHKDTLRISGEETHVQLFYLFPGTTYSVCIIPQNKDIATCQDPKPKQCASGQTNGVPETAYHVHSPPKANTSPFVIVGSTVAGVVIVAAVVIGVYTKRSRDFQFQRYNNEDDMGVTKQEERDPYKWESAYENIDDDDDRHVYVTSSSSWGVGNDKLDCTLAEPIPLPSVPQYVSL